MGYCPARNVSTMLVHQVHVIIRHIHHSCHHRDSNCLPPDYERNTVSTHDLDYPPPSCMTSFVNGPIYLEHISIFGLVFSNFQFNFDLFFGSFLTSVLFLDIWAVFYFIGHIASFTIII